MTIKRTVGRPVEMNYKIMSKLEDALEHGASVTEACRYAKISREGFYRYYRNEEVFKQKMQIARANYQYVIKIGGIINARIF